MTQSESVLRWNNSYGNLTGSGNTEAKLNVSKPSEDSIDHMTLDDRRELLRLVLNDTVYDEGQVAIESVIPLDYDPGDHAQLRPESACLKED